MFLDLLQDQRAGILPNGDHLEIQFELNPAPVAPTNVEVLVIKRSEFCVPPANRQYSETFTLVDDPGNFENMDPLYIFKRENVTADPNKINVDYMYIITAIYSDGRRDRQWKAFVTLTS